MVGIGFSELVAFHTAVMKRADSGNIPTESAAYRVMEEIESYERVGGLKNEISKLVMQKYAIDQRTVGGGFFLGFIAGYAIKKVIKLAAIIIGMFIAALAYLEYQRIVSVDWNRIQLVSQNGFVWVTDTIVHISSTIGASHSVTHIGIPLASSASAGMVLGLSRG